MPELSKAMGFSLGRFFLVSVYYLCACFRRSLCSLLLNAVRLMASHTGVPSAQVVSTSLESIVHFPRYLQEEYRL